jgi:hypothetical protein
MLLISANWKAAVIVSCRSIKEGLTSPARKLT